jgi:hypothetical protein
VAHLRAHWPRVLVAAGIVAAFVAAGAIRHSIVLWAAWVAGAAAVARLLVNRREGASLLAGVTVLFLLFLGLRAVPARLHGLTESYRSDSRFSSSREAESASQGAWGVDSGFVSYVSQRLPHGDPFFVSASSSLPNDAPQRWLQFELLPSVEQYGSPCSARWIVFYDSTAIPEGVELGGISTFKPGYALARVVSTCTS